MNIIRAAPDDPIERFAMISLLVSWGIKRCNVKGCTEIPTTYIGNIEGLDKSLAMCDKHFEEGSRPDGPTTFTFVWNNFNAFAYAQGER